MAPKFMLEAQVSYADVDRDEVMLLPRIFKLLQEAAIIHANQFGTGTRAMTSRQEGWVLNRIAAAVERYPRHDELLRVETWSNGIKGFKGLRDFRVYDAGQRPIIHATSLWLYISLKTKSIVRVPRDIAESFPVCDEGAWYPDLEKFSFEEPGVNAQVVPLSLRYSDVDVNRHVNNAAYLDLVQTALARVGANARPRQLCLKYAQALPPEIEAIEVHLAARKGTVTFSVRRGEVVFAIGQVEH